MISFSSRILSTAGRVMMLLALVAFVADVDAKGGRGRSSSARVSKKSDSEGSGTTIRLHAPGSSQSTGGTMPGATADGSAEPAPPPIDFAKPEKLSPAEAARRAALMEASEREQAEKAAAKKAAADREEAERVAAEKAAAARKAAAERAVAADVESVLQRAKSDYPVLNTPQGEPLLASIKARQKEIAARGTYPSVAMVQAVAHHEYLLRPPEARASFAAVAPPAQAATQPAAAEARSIGNCRWVTPIEWSCK